MLTTLSSSLFQYFLHLKIDFPGIGNNTRIDYPLVIGSGFVALPDVPPPVPGGGYSAGPGVGMPMPQLDLPS